MKRHLCAALAAALLMPGLGAVTARAQDNAAPAAKADSKPKDGERHEGWWPEGSMDAGMKEHLGLTDAQAGQFKDAVKAHKDAMKDIGVKMREANKALGEQLKSKAGDDAIQKSLDALNATRKAAVDENEKFRLALAAFLTPTQQARMLFGMEMHEHHHDGKKDGGK